MGSERNKTQKENDKPLTLESASKKSVEMFKPRLWMRYSHRIGIHRRAYLVREFAMRPVRTVVSGICLLIIFSTLPVGAQTGVAPATLKIQIDQQMPELITTYKQLHQHPELSHQEEQTSAYLAGELRKAGYEVTEHVGKYADGSAALGIVGILKNGAGPVALIRTDMDALPVTEATGLDYASHVRSQNAEKQDVGVMHACGHDIHMTVLLGVAHELATNKDSWHGTVELVGEPAEETIDGARAMLADGIYDHTAARLKVEQNQLVAWIG
jgi:Peptidase family M20/M25/M40